MVLQFVFYFILQDGQYSKGNSYDVGGKRY